MTDYEKEKIKRLHDELGEMSVQSEELGLKIRAHYDALDPAARKMALKSKSMGELAGKIRAFRGEVEGLHDAVADMCNLLLRFEELCEEGQKLTDNEKGE